MSAHTQLFVFGVLLTSGCHSAVFTQPDPKPPVPPIERSRNTMELSAPRDIGTKRADAIIAADPDIRLLLDMIINDLMGATDLLYDPLTPPHLKEEAVIRVRNSVSDLAQWRKTFGDLAELVREVEGEQPK